MRTVGHKLLALLLALPCAGAPAAERPYIELTAPGITLISAANERQTREIAQRIEHFRAALELSLSMTFPRDIPTRIYALSAQDWTRHGQPRAGLSGFFLSHPFSSSLLFNVDDATSSAYELMFHEYVHHTVRTLWIGEVPAFLDEGLAEVFSTARFEKGTVLLEPRSDYVHFVRGHDWIPFDRLLEIKRSDPEYVDHNLAPAFYAQAWATMYYALAAEPAFGARMTGFFRDLSKGGSRLGPAERLVGRAGIDVNGAVAHFIRRRERMPIAQIELAGLPSLHEFRLRKLSHVESTLAIAELMLRYGNRHEQALSLFEDAYKRHPEDIRVLIGMARAYLQARDWAKAAGLLEQLSAREVTDPESAVALGWAFYELASANSNKSEALNAGVREALTRARTLFDSALNEKSTRIEAISGYVLSSLALEGRGDALIVLAQLAYRSAPRSVDLAVSLAILHELEGEKALARQYWQQAARSVHTGPMRARIQNALQASEGSSE
jgi:tetratricopeptide (TPR) repeat protein